MKPQEIVIQHCDALIGKRHAVVYVHHDGSGSVCVVYDGKIRGEVRTNAMPPILAAAPALLAALQEIDDLLRGDLPITHQVKGIVRKALAAMKGQ